MLSPLAIIIRNTFVFVFISVNRRHPNRCLLSFKKFKYFSFHLFIFASNANRSLCPKWIALHSVIAYEKCRVIKMNLSKLYFQTERKNIKYLLLHGRIAVCTCLVPSALATIETPKRTKRMDMKKC